MTGVAKASVDNSAHMAPAYILAALPTQFKHGGIILAIENHIIAAIGDVPNHTER